MQVFAESKIWQKNDRATSENQTIRSLAKKHDSSGRLKLQRGKRQTGRRPGWNHQKTPITDPKILYFLGGNRWDRWVFSQANIDQLEARYLKVLLT